MTDTMFTRAALTEAAETAGVTTDQARALLEAAGVKVQPEKPEKPGPGTWHFTEGYMAPAPEVPAYVSKAGDLHLVHSDGRVEGFAGGSDAWPELTPARVVPGATTPVTLTERQVGELHEAARLRSPAGCAVMPLSGLPEAVRAIHTATVNAALAQHAAPAEGEPINPGSVRGGDRVRLVSNSGDEATFTVRTVAPGYLRSEKNLYDISNIHSIHLLHREDQP